MARQPSTTRQRGRAAARPSTPAPPASPATPVLPQPIRRPDRQSLFDALALAAVALLARLLYVGWARQHDPFFSWAAPGYDMHAYQAMASQILDGDWLLRAQGAFYFSPLYGYFSAAVQAIFGRGNFLAHHLTQAALGAASVGLGFIAARTWLGRLGAWLAGLALALAGPWLYYEQALLHESPILFCYAVLLWGVRTGALRWPWWGGRLAAAGAAAALAMMGRGNILAVLLVMGLWLLWVGGRRGRLTRPATWGWAPAGMLALGAAAVLAVVAWRNHEVTEQWSIGPNNGGVMFYAGNARDAEGTFNYSARFQEAFDLRTQEPGVYRRFFIEDLRAAPGAIAFGLLRKTLFFFEARDIPDNLNYHLATRMMLPLQLTPVRWGWLVPLGLVGMALAWPRRRDWLLLWLFAGALAGSLILIIPVGRYRAPFLLPAAIGAGFALEWALAWWRMRRRGPVVAAGLGVLVLALGLSGWWRIQVRTVDYHTATMAALDSGHYELGLKVSQWGLEEFPEYRPLLYARLGLAEAVGDYSLGLGAAETLLRQGSFRVGGLWPAAQAFIQAGRIEEAIALLQLLLVEVPDHAAGAELLRELEGRVK